MADMQGIEGLDSTRFAKVQRSELMPEAQVDPLIAGNQGLPIYVRVGDMPQNNDRPAASIEQSGDKKFIIIDESYHKWTPEYVRDRLTPSDTQLSQAFAKPERFEELYLKPDLQNFGDTTLADRQRRFDEFMASTQAGPDGKGGVVVDIAPNEYNGNYASVTSKEGTRHVVIRADALERAIASDEGLRKGKAAVGHEFSHFGEHSPAQTAAIHNQHQEKQLEMRADLNAPDTAALAATHRQTLAFEVRDYIEQQQAQGQGTPAGSMATVKAASAQKATRDTLHPSTFDRLSALELKESLALALSKRDPGADPKARDEWINGKLMEQYNKGDLPAPASLKPPPGLSGDAVQRLKSMSLEPMPMQDVHIHNAPQAPSADRGPRAIQ